MPMLPYQLSPVSALGFLTRRTASRSRPRPVLSCLRCRFRKIKCDRLLPCNQCALTGHDRQCSYNSQTNSGETVGRQTPNQSISRQALTDASLTDKVHSGDQAPAVTHTENRIGHSSETLDSLQRRLQVLEQLYSTHSGTLAKTLGGNEDGRDADRSLTRADAALSIKTPGPRYHSQNYKKLLFRQVSFICT